MLIVLVSILAPLLAPYDPLAQDLPYRLSASDLNHRLGTDDFGRDVLSRIIWGSRISLIIGTCSVAFGMIVGTILGMVAGYCRGKVETAIMRFIDVLMCFPDLILAVVLGYEVCIRAGLAASVRHRPGRSDAGARAVGDLSERDPNGMPGPQRRRRRSGRGHGGQDYPPS